MELYGPPLSEGTVRVAGLNPIESFVVEKPFFLAVTHTSIEDILETPLVVAHIREKYWKK